MEDHLCKWKAKAIRLTNPCCTLKKICFASKRKLLISHFCWWPLNDDLNSKREMSSMMLRKDSLKPVWCAWTSLWKLCVQRFMCTDQCMNQHSGRQWLSEKCAARFPVPLEGAMRQLDLVKSIQRYQLVDKAKLCCDLGSCPGRWLMLSHTLASYSWRCLAWNSESKPMSTQTQKRRLCVMLLRSTSSTQLIVQNSNHVSIWSLFYFYFSFVVLIHKQT